MNPLLRHQVNAQSKLLGAFEGRGSRIARNATFLAVAAPMIAAAPAHAGAAGGGRGGGTCGAAGVGPLITLIGHFGTFLLVLLFAIFPLTVLIGAIMITIPSGDSGRRKKGLEMVKWAFIGMGIAVLLFFGQEVALKFLAGAAGGQGQTLQCDPGIQIG